MKSLFALLFLSCLTSVAMAEATAELPATKVWQQKLPPGASLRQREIWLREAAERGELSPAEARAWRRLQKRLHDRPLDGADTSQVEKRSRENRHLPRLRWRQQQDAWHAGDSEVTETPEDNPGTSR